MKRPNPQYSSQRYHSSSDENAIYEKRYKFQRESSLKVITQENASGKYGGLLL